MAIKCSCPQCGRLLSFQKSGSKYIKCSCGKRVLALSNADRAKFLEKEKREYLEKEALKRQKKLEGERRKEQRRKEKQKQQEKDFADAEEARKARTIDKRRRKALGEEPEPTWWQKQLSLSKRPEKKPGSFFLSCLDNCCLLIAIAIILFVLVVCGIIGSG